MGPIPRIALLTTAHCVLADALVLFVELRFLTRTFYSGIQLDSYELFIDILIELTSDIGVFQQISRPC